MVPDAAIEEKIAAHKEKLGLLTRAMGAEMQKKAADRDDRLLDFLYKEKAVYQMVVTELESLLNREKHANA